MGSVPFEQFGDVTTNLAHELGAKSEAKPRHLAADITPFHEDRGRADRVRISTFLIAFSNELLWTSPKMASFWKLMIKGFWTVRLPS